MSNSIPYTSIERIFSKIDRDLMSEFNEGNVVEWTAEALEAIGAVRQYEEAVAFIEVRNHQCVLPAGFHAIIQVARNNCWTAPTDTGGLCAADVPVVTVADNPADEPPANCPVVLDCNGTPLQQYDLAYYRPYFDLRYDHSIWTGCGVYRNCFTPIGLSDHTFFNSIVCAPQDNDIYQSCNDEYTIVRGVALRFSFKDGQIALSYLRQVLDEETGFPMIPDHYSYTTAILKYITMKIMERDFYAGKEGSESRLRKSEQDWHWYCKQAGNYSMMIKGVDEYENQLKQRSYLIPQTQRYVGFFGKLNRAEDRRAFNSPNGRHGYGYFRGLQ